MTIINLKNRQNIYRLDPVRFFREVLLFSPDDWQIDAAFSLVHNSRVSIRSGQGVGKTAFEAAVLLWFLSCFSYSRVVATAPTRQQLNDVLWSEVSKWLSNSPILSAVLKWTKTYIYMAGNEKRWFAVARTATKPENMQGFHEDNMLFIVDEASGVAEPIMEAILGTLSGQNNKLLLCGNPTKTSGTFFDSHHNDKDLYRTHKVSSLDSSRTNKDNINSLIRKFGIHSNVVRVRVFGDFPIDEDDVFISSSLAESGVLTQQILTPVTTIDIGVDVARFGSDNTVIAAKVNNSILPLFVKNGADTSLTAEESVLTARQLRSKYAFNGKIYVKIDDTGVGGGVTDSINKIKRLNDLDWLIVVPVNFNSSVNHAYYQDFNTFLWGNLKDLLESGDITLPDDPLLIGELTARKKGFSPNGKIKLESKLDMKKRGLPSPDRADAAALAALPLLRSADKNKRREGKRRS